jgi:hypothetical protein
LTGAAIVLEKNADALCRYAAGELARYLFLLTRRPSKVVQGLPRRGPAILLTTRRGAGRASRRPQGAQGFAISMSVTGKRPVLTISARTSRGVLYAAYDLLERLGMGFYAGGETYPEVPRPAAIRADLEIVKDPVFSVRGNMLHYNFLCGCTDWGLEDYKFYFDQLARMRCNMLLMHWYDGEPGAAYEVDGEYLAGGRTPNSLGKPWGALAALRTSQFHFGSGRFFDGEVYSSPAGEDPGDLLSEIKATERMWAQATAYARTAGIEIAAGFEEPRGDPTDRGVVRLFEARIHQFLERNPNITHFALWQHESGGCFGTSPPPPSSAAGRLLARKRGPYDHLGNEHRVWEAVRFGEFAEIATRTVATVAPELRVVIVGWGGDRWMRFADLCLGYDKVLPPNVAFTCHDNIDASFGPNVSTAWGELPPERERWAMPWVEGDIDECWVRQPNVESLGLLAPDALAKGCQGLLTLQWRTRDVEEETGFVARYAWDPELTPDRFYRDMARHSFGAEHEGEMSTVLGQLQKLGARWTGVRGTPECGKMRWAGMGDEHVPFEPDGEAAAMLARLAAAASDALAEVPSRAGTAGDGAFHERSSDGEAKTRDDSRPGARELQAVASELNGLAARGDPAAIGSRFREIEEDLWGLRKGLVEFGMTSRSYQGLDLLLIYLHHLQRNAGAEAHMKALRALRRSVSAVREQLLARGRLPRIERLDYLAATMDFALGYDSAVLHLASGETVDKALAAARAAQQRGDAGAAAAEAAEAYDTLVGAGMRQAVEAFTRKLTTRCDFGTLATINVKALPLYWETVGRLEAFMPAVPPRELAARGKNAEVWLSWDDHAKGTSLSVYRKSAGSGRWKRVSKRPLAGSARMFIDRPRQSGVYEYAVTASDAEGWESPRSHIAAASTGVENAGPRIVACKPAGRHPVNTPVPVKVTVLSDRGIGCVSVRFRRAGQRKWQTARLWPRFRNSLGGVIPSSVTTPGVLEYYVEAVDEEGKRSFWPESAPSGLPWSIVFTVD